jgi:hypothetical protein
MATLKISDLSVGDWVRYETMPTKVMTINGFDSVVRGKASNGNIVIAHIDCFEPIPITAEILVKNDFVRRSDEFSIYEYTTLLGKILRTTQVFLTTPQCINVFLHDTTIERGYIHREKTSVSIHRNELYVHDLQHALRLAGLDKEINL